MRPVSFQALGISDPLLRAVADYGYQDPTAVQSAVIPEVLRGRDVWVKASTGAGKTAAFVLPILELLSRRELVMPRRVHALVLVPTRELAKQTADTISALRRHLRQRPKTVVVLGGVSINPQMMQLRGGADIVVATPGRLLDLVDKNALSLATVSQLVLDEADRLLEMGFADELGRVVAQLPANRQTLLFSATLGPAVSRVAEPLLRTPVSIDVTDAPTDLPAIQQRAIEVDTPRRTQLSQGARTRALDMFRASSIHVLVATDLAARGLDITGLPAVVNYDLPRSPNDYVHRIGRTGRAGESGVAISFVTAEMQGHFAVIERRHRHYVVRERVVGFEPTQTPTALLRPSTGGVKGRRKSKKDKLREAAARAHELGS